MDENACFFAKFVEHPVYAPVPFFTLFHSHMTAAIRNGQNSLPRGEPLTTDKPRTKQPTTHLTATHVSGIGWALPTRIALVGSAHPTFLRRERGGRNETRRDHQAAEEVRSMRRAHG